jgi:hypothetical protein
MGSIQVLEARRRGQAPFAKGAANTARPSFVSRSRGIALNETSHDHGRHCRARDAGVLAIRIAGDAEQQDALVDDIWDAE